MNQVKQLKEYANNELLNEILDRIDKDSTVARILADLYIFIGKISVENPELYQAIVKEVMKKNN